MAHTIPCPVCGGDLEYRRWPFLEGVGMTALMVDCPLRHHARTAPQKWEWLRLGTWLRDAEAKLADMVDHGPSLGRLMTSEDPDPSSGDC